MEYLVIIGKKAFYTNWYDYKNNYAKGMVVVNLLSNKITFDGKIWIDIEEDYL